VRYRGGLVSLKNAQALPSRQGKERGVTLGLGGLLLLLGILKSGTRNERLVPGPSGVHLWLGERDSGRGLARTEKGKETVHLHLALKEVGTGERERHTGFSERFYNPDHMEH